MSFRESSSFRARLLVSGALVGIGAIPGCAAPTDSPTADESSGDGSSGESAGSQSSEEASTTTSEEADSSSTQGEAESTSSSSTTEAEASSAEAESSASVGDATTSSSETTEEGESEEVTTGETGGLAMRTECPEPPPGAGDTVEPERNYSISDDVKNAYLELIQAQEPFQGTRGSLPWHFYEPPQVAENPDALFPLVLVLHGGYGREVENGNVRVDAAQYLLGSSNGLLTETNRETFPTYIVAPHCRVGEGCVFGTNEWSSDGGAFFEIRPEPSVAGGTAVELVEHLIDAYAVDPARIYVTGNSMGGGGTWEFIQRWPELFAAGVPVSGHPPSYADLDVLAASKVPVWAFRGDNDPTNPSADTMTAVEHLTDNGGCAWMTTYSNTGHDDALWANPYMDERLWAWLFAQRIPRVGEPGAGDPFP